MKPFRFPLEVVLAARHAQVAEAGHHLALALEQQNAAMTRSREAVQVLNLLLHSIAVASSGRFSAADRERFWSMRRRQEETCTELRKAAQACSRVTEEKRAAVIAARRNCELLERLKSSRHTAWQKETVRAEQHLFDEFAMTRRHQVAQQEPALC